MYSLNKTILKKSIKDVFHKKKYMMVIVFLALNIWLVIENNYETSIVVIFLASA